MPASILVVDDDEAVRVMLARLVESAGFAAVQARNAAQARQRLEEDSFELLIIDVVMPGESGLDLASAARRSHPRTPIILVSGYATEAPRAFAEANEGILFVAKPFGADQFLALIRSMVEPCQA